MIEAVRLRANPPLRQNNWAIPGAKKVSSYTQCELRLIRLEPMRPLLIHEKRIVQTLTPPAGAQIAWKMPETIYGYCFPNPAAASPTVEINGGFTLFFEEDRGPRAKLIRAVRARIDSRIQRCPGTGASRADGRCAVDGWIRYAGH